MSKPTIPLKPGNYYHIYNRGINSCPIFYDDADHERFLYLYGKYVGPVADTLTWVLMRTHIHFLLWIKEDVVYRYSMKELKQMEQLAGPRTNADRSGDPVASPPRDATGFSRADATGFSGETAGVSPSPEDALSFAKWETVSISNAGRQDSGTSAGGDAGEGFPDVSGCGEATKKTPNPSAHIGHLFNAYARYFNLKYTRHGSLFEHQFKRKPVEKERYLRNVVVYIHKNPEHHGYYADFSKYPLSSYHFCFNEQPALINRKEIMEWFGNLANFALAHKGHMNMQTLEELLED